MLVLDLELEIDSSTGCCLFVCLLVHVYKICSARLDGLNLNIITYCVFFYFIIFN